VVEPVSLATQGWYGWFACLLASSASGVEAEFLLRDRRQRNGQGFNLAQLEE
jgi:hypothetical protein